MPQKSSHRVSASRRAIFWTILAIGPALILLAIAELTVRVTGLDQPRLRTSGLGEEAAGFIQPDPLLFWSLRPGFQGTYREGQVSINSIGLRGPEVEQKGTNEFRILSVGESSTFGVSVSDGETYSARLEQLLNSTISSRRFKVINAGVSAYSSFQSLKFLEHRGLNLKPDLILFYHELNDYIPSSLRDSHQNEVGVTLTDKELFNSRLEKVKSFLNAHCALCRFLNLRQAALRIRKFNKSEFTNPMSNIGLSSKIMTDRIENGGGFAANGALNERALGRRVSDQERIENFRELQKVCKTSGIKLIIMHPAYRYSQPHECLLTRFCKENDVLMFDAFAPLHPADCFEQPLYSDAWHPSAEGHLILAGEVAGFITEHFFAGEKKTNIPDQNEFFLTDGGRGDESRDPKLCNGKGAALLQEGNLDQAMYQFQCALRLNPQYAEAHSNLGVALCGTGLLDEGIKQFQKTLALQPHSAEAHTNLGIALARRGSKREAEIEFREALKLKPDSPDLLRHLAALRGN